MKVEDYEYMGYDDLEEDVTLTEERKDELIKKVKDEIVRENIAVHKILRIAKTNAEYEYIYDWLEENQIRISGINGTLSGELEDYNYIKRLGVEKIPEPLEDDEQQNLFIKLNNLKQKGVHTDSKEYQDIRQKLIMHNMKLAAWVVQFRYGRTFEKLPIEKQDLQQMAMEALIKAVDGYDASQGNKFSTYAVKSIYYYVRRTYDRMPNHDQNLRKEWRRLDRFEEEMLKNVERQPTDEEIKEFLGIGEKRLQTLKAYIQFHLQESLDNLNKEDEELIGSEFLNDEAIAEIESNPILDGIYMDEKRLALETGKETTKVDVLGEMSVFKEDLEEVLDTLTPREEKVIQLRFGLLDGKSQTLDEVSAEFKTTRERIRQIEAKALRKLRHPSRSRTLREYMREIENEEWYQYRDIYDEITEKNEIMERIRAKSSELSQKKKETDSQSQEKYLHEENKKDDIFEKDSIDSTIEEFGFQEDMYLYEEEKETLQDEIAQTIEGMEELEIVDNTLEDNDKQKVERSIEQETEQYKQSLGQVTNLEDHSKSETYLDEISELLSELDELDKMLKQTTIAIKSEKDKKQKNKELKAKMKKVEDLMQK